MPGLYCQVVYFNTGRDNYYLESLKKYNEKQSELQKQQTIVNMADGKKEL